MARICIVTAGHLATCPRMVKAADALAERHDVRVVSARFLAWATAADESVRRTARWTWTEVAYDRNSGREYVWTGFRSRASLAAAGILGPSRVPVAVATRALSRAHDELMAAALEEPADLIYGGTNGALAAVAEAAGRSGSRYALDLEDFHSGESGDVTHNGLAERVEAHVLASAASLTTASDAMAAAYLEKYGVEPRVVHNTFPLPSRRPEFARHDRSSLRLYWFSQTIGLDRGLQDAILAAGRTGMAVQLDLRGRPAPGAVERLQRLAADAAPRLTLNVLPPAEPVAMVELCRGYDVGLSLEQPSSTNKRVALGNKALTYPLAGLAVAMTDTPGHRRFAGDLGPGALVCAPGDVDGLAAGLKRWAEDGELLQRAKRAAWDAAERQWNWDCTDRHALVAAIERALS